MTRTELLSRSWVDAALVALYLGAVVAANTVVSIWGQVALPFTAFILIPFDLVIRDLLQDRWAVVDRWEMWGRMLALVTVGACFSLAGEGTMRVAASSCCAFFITGIIDCATYQRMIRWGRIFRINAATVVGAATDTLVFVSLAFDSVSWPLVWAQIGMKVAGGVVWSLLLYRLFRRYNAATARSASTRDNLTRDWAGTFGL